MTMTAWREVKDFWKAEGRFNDRAPLHVVAWQLMWLPAFLVATGIMYAVVRVMFGRRDARRVLDALEVALL